MAPIDDGATPASIDRSVLEQMRSQFTGSRMVESAEIVAKDNLYLHVDFSDNYYPGEVSARFEIRWYRNEDFNIHYQETHKDDTWKCRWDRHPNTHNERAHFHPPPAASRIESEDAEWPNDHRDVCQIVVECVRNRIETLWDA